MNSKSTKRSCFHSCYDQAVLGGHEIILAILLRMLRIQDKPLFHLFSYRSEVKARQDVKPDIRQPPFTDYRQPPLDYRQPPGGDYQQPPPLDYRQPPLLDYRQHSPDTRQYPLSDYRQPQVPQSEIMAAQPRIPEVQGMKQKGRQRKECPSGIENQPLFLVLISSE